MRAQLFTFVGAALAFAPVAAAQTPESDVVTEVFFPFDSSDLGGQATASLDAAAKAVGEAPGGRVVISGHADPRGTAPYNVGLSVRRAEAVRDYLIGRGVDRDSIVMAFYGEDGAPRDTFAEDRRVTVAVTDQPLYTIVDEAMPAATGLTWGRPATTAEIEGPLRERPPAQMARR